MKFDVKIAIIVALVAVIIMMLVPQMSFADEMSPSPSPLMNAKCMSELFAISDLCPKHHPLTGDITPDGQKYCCQ